MEFKAKIFLFTILGLFSLSIITTVPTIAFPSDSYSQQVGDEFVWEFKEIINRTNFLWKNPQVGDRFKCVIVATNLTTMGPHNCDTVWAEFYNNSAANRTWTPLDIGSPGEDMIAAYNSTIGIVPVPQIPILFPHNATAVTNFMIASGSAMGGGYTWAPASNGYDGMGAYWEDNETMPGAIKFEVHINDRGVMQTYKVFTINGTQWELKIHLELLSDTAPVPGFLLSFALLTLGTCMILSILIMKKKSAKFL